MSKRTQHSPATAQQLLARVQVSPGDNSLTMRPLGLNKTVCLRCLDAVTYGLQQLPVQCLL